MTAGFGFCANCGTPATSPAEQFCASCGTALPGHAAAAMAAATPPPPPPPPYAQPPYAQQPYAPVQPGWGGPPMAPARGGVNPLLVLAGVVLIAAIAGVGIYAYSNSSKGSPGPSSGASGNVTGYPGTIVFSPASVGCDGSFTITTTLPGSVKETDQITSTIDGAVEGSKTVLEAGLTKQADGTWSGTKASGADCSIGAGAHTEQLLDASGKVLAQGTVTFVASSSANPTAQTTANPTANPTAKQTAKTTAKPTAKTTGTLPPVAGGSVTFKPNSFSCSGAAVTVTMTITLPASFSGSDLIYPDVDGSVGSSTTVDSIFEQQADGSWLETESNTNTNLCGAYSVGNHTIGIEDDAGNIVAMGSFTVKP